VRTFVSNYGLVTLTILQDNGFNYLKEA